MVATTTTVHEVPIKAPPRISWGAVFAGTLVALGVWALLYAFGLAIGLSSVSPQDTGSLRAAGIGTGIWGIIAPLIALFIGGVVAARESGVAKRSDGAIHGLVLWSLTTVLGMLLLTSVVTSVVGGAARTLGRTAAVGTVAGAAGGGGQGAAAQGINANDLLAPINARLQAEGKPTITAAQLEASVRAAVTQAFATGSFDRETLTSSIAANTRLSRADANEIATRVEASWNQAAQQLQTQAAAAADTTGKAMWGVTGALFLGLLAAMLGAALGVDRSGRRRRREVVTEAPGPSTYVPAH